MTNIHSMEYSINKQKKHIMNSKISNYIVCLDKFISLLVNFLCRKPLEHFVCGSTFLVFCWFFRLWLCAMQFTCNWKTFWIYAGTHVLCCLYNLFVMCTLISTYTSLKLQLQWTDLGFELAFTNHPLYVSCLMINSSLFMVLNFFSLVTRPYPTSKAE